MVHIKPEYKLWIIYQWRIFTHNTQSYAQPYRERYTMYVHICMCTATHTHTHGQTYAHTHTHTYMYTNVCTHTVYKHTSTWLINTWWDRYEHDCWEVLQRRSFVNIVCTWSWSWNIIKSPLHVCICVCVCVQLQLEQNIPHACSRQYPCLYSPFKQQNLQQYIPSYKLNDFGYTTEKHKRL